MDKDVRKTIPQICTFTSIGGEELKTTYNDQAIGISSSSLKSNDFSSTSPLTNED